MKQDISDISNVMFHGPLEVLCITHAYIVCKVVIDSVVRRCERDTKQDISDIGNVMFYGPLEVLYALCMQ